MMVRAVREKQAAEGGTLPDGALCLLPVAEVDVISKMIAIAGAGCGDGDYASWSDEDWAALESLREKVASVWRLLGGK